MLIMDKTFSTPILLITFNRPNHTRRVWDAIKKQQPKYMYVFQDGPREGNETDKEKCSAVRAIFDEPLDWDCEIKTFYSDVNLGCGKGPVTGISWFFENVEAGLIFEDDAVPHSDFFDYAAQLLDRYYNHAEIRAIGSMKIDRRQYGNSSYYFSMMNRNLCAWATWRRAWKDFDYYLDNVSIKELRKSLRKYSAGSKEILYWSERLQEIHSDRLNESSWDIQFLISIWLNNGVGICPNVNLSTNIGFDPEGTHTTNHNSSAANLETHSILPLSHPTIIKVNRESDLNYDKLYFQPVEYGWSGIKRFPFRMNKRVKLFLGKEGSWFK